MIPQTQQAKTFAISGKYLDRVVSALIAGWTISRLLFHLIVSPIHNRCAHDHLHRLQRLRQVGNQVVWMLDAN